MPKSCFFSPKNLRRIIIEQSKRAHVGHIGSALSIIDIIYALYSNILNIPSLDNPDRDRFVLSKGHAVLAIYATFYLKGWISEKDLNLYCQNNSLLGVHPGHLLTGVDFSTGSLGQGLSFAAGAALAANLQRSRRKVFVIVSDAECNEGSTWETVMFSAHHRLSNLVVILDLNGQQALGYTNQILDLSPIGKRWESFGWGVTEVDGHDVAAITKTIENLDVNSGIPAVVIAHTIFGKGVNYMENQLKWHYSPMSDEEYLEALDEIEKEN